MEIDYKDFSNTELKLEQERLYNLFEKIKTEIKEKYIELSKLDKEYNKIENEINLRKNILL